MVWRIVMRAPGGSGYRTAGNTAAGSRVTATQQSNIAGRAAPPSGGAHCVTAMAPSHSSPGGRPRRRLNQARANTPSHRMREATVGALLVAIFDDEDAASAAVQMLRTLHADGTLTLYAAAVVG